MGRRPGAHSPSSVRSVSARRDAGQSVPSRIHCGARSPADVDGSCCRHDDRSTRNEHRERDVAQPVASRACCDESGRNVERPRDAGPGAWMDARRVSRRRSSVDWKVRATGRDTRCAACDVDAEPRRAPRGVVRCSAVRCGSAADAAGWAARDARRLLGGVDAPYRASGCRVGQFFRHAYRLRRVLVVGRETRRRGRRP
ncbi:hypothetical protein SAMN05421642_1232 [Rhodococcoides kyotonense]|uniref:Uncharacterized protein n=1 Tax=Rhodococcoides kyotonense TaxID=398843 RepID=A0A239MWD5_9NOCA|nr:hypothetical protein SAMN05421642_1232 [Rhodococcus kyotonensis]